MELRSFSYYAVKTVRLTGWLLLPLTGVYILSGLVMCGHVNLGPRIGPQLANVPHRAFVWPLVVLVGLHSLGGVYLAFRRWGWIGRRTKT